MLDTVGSTVSYSEKGNAGIEVDVNVSILEDLSLSLSRLISLSLSAFQLILRVKLLQD